jgi:hypothetical protein
MYMHACMHACVRLCYQRVASPFLLTYFPYWLQENTGVRQPVDPSLAPPSDAIEGYTVGAGASASVRQAYDKAKRAIDQRLVETEAADSEDSGDGAPDNPFRDDPDPVLREYGMALDAQYEQDRQGTAQVFSPTPAWTWVFRFSLFYCQTSPAKRRQKLLPRRRMPAHR